MNTPNQFTPLDLIDQIDNHQVITQKLTWLKALFSAAKQSLANGHESTALELIELGQYVSEMWAGCEEVEAEQLTRIKQETAQ